MNIINEIINLENTFTEISADYIHKEDFTIYFNSENSESHDSNHAIIFKNRNTIQQNIHEITEFYKKKSITPRFYQSFNFDFDQILINELSKQEFTITRFENRYYLLSKPAACNPVKTMIKSIREYIPEITELFDSDPDKGPWIYNGIKFKLRSKNYHLFGGYLNNKLITIASLQSNGIVTRVDEVFTHYKYRRNGYANELIAFLTSFHQTKIKDSLYLYTSNENAYELYEKNGFTPLNTSFKCWSATK